MVCDGVGGQDKGEVASSLACESFHHFFEENAHKEIDQTFIHEAISTIQAAFNAYISQHPEASQMATTLTLAILHPHGISMSHLGDSRIYYFRNGAILYQTRDHNLVNELIDNDIITPDEARHSTQKHIITRAVSAVASQSANPSYHLQTDLQTGDLLLLCTDGVTESLSSDALTHLCTLHPHLSDLTQAIEAACAQHSHDNHSAMIVQIVNI